MTLHLHNDDPRCRQQQDCRMGSWHNAKGVCNRCVREARLEAAERALQINRKLKFVPPAYVGVYLELQRKVGAREARRMVVEQYEHDQRKSSA